MRDRLAGAAYAAGWRLVRALPEPVARRAFTAGADLAARRQGPGTRRLVANLRRVVGGEPSPELVRAALRSYGRYWLETFRLPVMDHPAVVAATRTEGVDNLDKAYADGRGVIVALPHMGNWDVAAIWTIAHGMPFTTVAERLRPESLYRRFLAYRESLGVEVLPLTGGARPAVEVLAERLRAGRVICLVGDRDLTRSGVEVDLFGERARMPSGPALLAATTGAALLPVGLWFEGEGWGQGIGPPVPVPEQGRLRDRVAAATQALADAFAVRIAAHPADWHMLQRLWLADLDPAKKSGAGGGG
ncbi:MAG TPA: phosphatidylinositol mannoside acyltransferase [Mycobacteriales bacterium]|nr:phosphatidylinositol mannoside acyltransferase [Mycobacteriales bacterium]